MVRGHEELRGEGTLPWVRWIKRQLPTDLSLLETGLHLIGIRQGLSSCRHPMGAPFTLRRSSFGEASSGQGKLLFSHFSEPGLLGGPRAGGQNGVEQDRSSGCRKRVGSKTGGGEKGGIWGGVVEGWWGKLS